MTSKALSAFLTCLVSVSICGQQVTCPASVGSVGLNKAAEGTNVVKTVDRFGVTMQSISCAYGITGSDIYLSAQWMVKGSPTCDCVPSQPPAYAWQCSESRHASVYITNPWYPDIKADLIAAAKDLLGQAEHFALLCPGIEIEQDSTPEVVCECPDDLALRFGFKLVESPGVNVIQEHPHSDGKAQRILCTYTPVNGDGHTLDITAFWVRESPADSSVLFNTCNAPGLDIVNSDTRQAYARVAGWQTEYERTAMLDLGAEILGQVELYAPLCRPQKGWTYTIWFEGEPYTTTYERQVGDDGRWIDVYYFKVFEFLGVQAVQDGKALWGRFVREPSVDDPDQSNVSWWYVTWILNDGRYEEEDREGVSVTFE